MWPDLERRHVVLGMLTKAVKSLASKDQICSTKRTPLTDGARFWLLDEVGVEAMEMRYSHDFVDIQTRARALREDLHKDL